MPSSDFQSFIQWHLLPSLLRRRFQWAHQDPHHLIDHPGHHACPGRHGPKHFNYHSYIWKHTVRIVMVVLLSQSLVIWYIIKALIVMNLVLRPLLIGCPGVIWMHDILTRGLQTLTYIIFKVLLLPKCCFYWVYWFLLPLCWSEFIFLIFKYLV